MSKKRPNKDKGVSQTPAKVSKKDVLEFNGTVFKSMLQDPTSVMKGKSNNITAAIRMLNCHIKHILTHLILHSLPASEAPSDG